MKSLLPFTLLFLLAIASYAQTEPTSAPVEWKRYMTAEYQVTVMLPKLPFVQEVVDKCNDTLSMTYYAYAEGAVYEVTVSGKLRNDRGKNQICLTRVMKFGPATLENRLTKLGETGTVTERSTGADGRAVVKLKAERWTRWIVSDMANKRWIEMAVHHYPNEKIDPARFLETLEFSATGGVEIGAGSEKILGDPTPEKPIVAPTPDAASPSTPKVIGSGSGSGPGPAAPSTMVTIPKVTAALWIVSKPRARYTDQARQAFEVGTVVLKVTLLANGSVGTVTVVKPLQFGLTEQSIAAARKIVFIPKRVNGVHVSSIVTLEYGFTIY